MNSELFSRVRTIEERSKLVSEIDLLLSSIYEDQGKGFESCLKNKVRHWVSEIVRSEISNDPSAMHEYLGQVKNELEKLEVIKLTLAFEPSDATIDKFFDFVAKNVEERVVLEFEFDARILGGALITYKGEYRDFSLKRLFEEEYLEKEKDIIKIMYSKPAG